MEQLCIADNSICYSTHGRAQHPSAAVAFIFSTIHLLVFLFQYKTTSTLPATPEPSHDTRPVYRSSQPDHLC